MHPAFKVLIVAAVLAIVVVVVRYQGQSDEQSGWAQYGVAEFQGLTVESLEAAREQARDTSAEPWIAYQLAIKLYESGGSSQRDRAKEIAQEALGRFPDHPSAGRFQHLIEVVDSYAGVPDEV